jgi:transposase
VVCPNPRSMGAGQQPTYDELVAVIAGLRERLAAAEERVAELERRLGGGSGSTPHFVKANRPPKPEGPPRERKKREENHARPLEEPTEQVVHSLERCPDCDWPLSEGWVARRRQVIDIPALRYIVREHVVMGHHCGVCGKDHIAPCDLSEEVVGQRRISARVMALVAGLRTEFRLPLSKIREFFQMQYGLSLSIGTLTDLLQATAERGRPQYEALREELRASPVVHADETGWREDGRNGYLWGFMTPTLRWFCRTQTRASTVPLAVLGAEYTGVVVADFYSGYTPLNCRKQRCWVHLLRDLKALEEKYPKRTGIARWRGRFREVYAQATAYRAEQLGMIDPAPMSLRRERAKARGKFESLLRKLARPYLTATSDPRQVLAKRIIQFLHELFVFVEHPEVPPENNAAERGLRATVVARKVSGGSRSPRGSETMAILRSLFATWSLRARPPLDACRQLLLQPCA